MFGSIFYPGPCKTQKMKNIKLREPQQESRCSESTPFRESHRLVCSSGHVERIRSARVLDSRPWGMLRFNRLLIMLEPVTTLSDDEQHVLAAKAAAKGKGKGAAPKTSEKVPAPKHKAKAKSTPNPKAKSTPNPKAKSSSSHPPMERPSAKAKPKASTKSDPTPPKGYETSSGYQ